MSRLVMLLLLDAFRPDYLARLAERSATGTLREPFGFVGRPAYFGALTPGQFGFSNMYCYGGSLRA